MEKVSVSLDFCYGINKLRYDFDFTNSQAYAIYAPNGAMKTSFSRTFSDLMRSEPSKDQMFPSRPTNRSIIDASGAALSPDSVYVIEPYPHSGPFLPGDVSSTLLVNQEIKAEYDKVHGKINEKKTALLKRLAQLSGFKASDIENIFTSSFGNSEFFEISDSIAERLSVQPEGAKGQFSSIPLSSIFNEKVRAFLSLPDTQAKIREYMEKYEELVGKSRFLKSGFDHYKAATVQKTLNDQGFFVAKHSVNFFDGTNKTEVSDAAELNSLIEEEKATILSDAELSRRWGDLDKKLNANADLRTFRDILKENREILPKLSDLDKFGRDIWMSYLTDERALFFDFFKEYSSGKDEILRITAQAEKEKTLWENVVNTFNLRFFVPFKIRIKNRSDSVIKGDVPTLDFIFEENGEKSEPERSELLSVLSQGEKRALYLLNVLFKIEEKRSSGVPTLIIVDDVADSFDYKNKYAIIQYLNELSNNPEYADFKLIILTHNFDFFRTIESRGVVKYPCCLFVSKDSSQISLSKAEGIRNPFGLDWKNNLSDPAKFVASIPFVRNLIEYTLGMEDANYSILTSALHLKEGTDGLMVDDFEEPFKSAIASLSFPDELKGGKYFDLLLAEADKCLSAPSGSNLANKIVLSIAIRLLAEKHMIDRIADPSFVSLLSNDQTGKLFGKYKRSFAEDADRIAVLERVNLMTPENIHLNSFMYEPILDIADEHLRKLYEDVKVIG